MQRVLLYLLVLVTFIFVSWHLRAIIPTGQEPRWLSIVAPLSAITTFAFIVYLKLTEKLLIDLEANSLIVTHLGRTTTIGIDDIAFYRVSAIGRNILLCLVSDDVVVVPREQIKKHSLLDLLHARGITDQAAEVAEPDRKHIAQEGE